MKPESNPFADHGYGESRPWLDLVNSEHWDGFGNFTDMLDHPDWVDAFLHFWEFRIPLREPFPQAEFRSLRAWIRTRIEKAASGQQLHMEQFARLNDWMKVSFHPQLLEDQNGLHIRLRAIQSGWSTTLGEISYSFADSLIDHGQRRLRICQNPGCRWIFIDRSKGNVRRWCNTATCGNRERVRKARASRKR